MLGTTSLLHREYNIWYFSCWFVDNGVTHQKINVSSYRSEGEARIGDDFECVIHNIPSIMKKIQVLNEKGCSSRMSRMKRAVRDINDDLPKDQRTKTSKQSTTSPSHFTQNFIVNESNSQEQMQEHFW